jgi:hypothetical protein
VIGALMSCNSIFGAGDLTNMKLVVALPFVDVDPRVGGGRRDPSRSALSMIRGD